LPANAGGEWVDLAAARFDIGSVAAIPEKNPSIRKIDRMDVSALGTQASSIG